MCNICNQVKIKHLQNHLIRVALSVSIWVTIFLSLLTN